MHKADVRGKERKALRRAAHPEVKTKFPPAKKLGKLRWGIRYRWVRNWGLKSWQSPPPPSTRWFATARGRDQAFRHMERGCQLPGGKVYHLYKDLEKITR